MSRSRPIVTIQEFVFHRDFINYGGWALDLASHTHDLVVELTRHGLRSIYAGLFKGQSRAAESPTLFLETSHIVTESSPRTSDSLSVDALMDKYGIEFFDVVFIRPGPLLDSWKGVWSRQLCVYHGAGNFINKAALPKALNEAYPSAATDGRCLLLISRDAVHPRKGF